MKSYIGIDLSTQQLKILAIDDDFNTMKEICISFDKDIYEYKTTGGAHIHDDKLTVTVPTEMWVKALDIGLMKLKNEGFDFSTVTAISGTGQAPISFNTHKDIEILFAIFVTFVGDSKEFTCDGTLQQHGSVYWKNCAKSALENLDSNLSLHEQLANQFSVTDSPIWMDSSTSAVCRYLEQCLGGEQALSDITGSKAYERFTGNQIRKVFLNQRQAYDNTERISLVSSFVASLLLGNYAPIDFSDGSGMNMLDIRKKSWDKKCLDAIAVGLEDKLGHPVSSSSNLGCISSYYCKKYGFDPQCCVIAFTGDNPASLAGCRLQKGDVVVSLGTSDTLILWIDDPKPSTEGHIFVNPINDNAFMALLCFKNGSLIRDKFRRTYADDSWEKFSSALRETTPANNGKLGIYFDVQEIIPNAVGEYRFEKNDEEVSSFSNREEIRSLVEGQFMAKRYHAEKLGYKLTSSSRILATGGASKNPEILQVLSDVFQAPVYTLDTSNSACLGCAYRAKHGVLGGSATDFSSIFPDPPSYQLAARPAKVDYDITRYGRLETLIADT